jgi:TatD DNase family protein
MLLIDSHCHLDFPDFAADRAAAIQRANALGVETLLTISTSLKEVPRVLAVAEENPQIYCTVGVHPHTADQELVTAEDLITRATHAKVVGIGETGLDYYYETSNRANQQADFRAHIHAARETGLPIIVHTRDADDDTALILQEEYKKGAFKGLIHCFTASHPFAEAALDLGFYISLSGIITFKTAAALRETVAKLPLDRLLVETDSPYLAPLPHRGKRNEPSFVVHTAEKLAEIKGVSLQQVATQTTENFYTLFDKVPRPLKGVV